MTDMPEIKEFAPKRLFAINLFLLCSSIFAYLIYSWFQNGNWLSLLMTIVPFIGTYYFGRFLFYGQSIVIENNEIIRIKYRFEEEYTGRISKALYETVIDKDGIRCYKFKFEGEDDLILVSPWVYKKCAEMVSIMTPFVRKDKMKVNNAIFM